MNTAQSPTTSNRPAKPYLPDDPATTTTSDADDALLGAFICSTEPISEFIREHNISMHELVRWCRRDDIAQVIDAVTKLHEARAKLQIIMAAHDAVITLKFIAMTQRPSSAQEISRRAANTLLKLAFPEVKPTSQVAPASRPVSSPTPPPTPPPTSPPSKPRHLDTSTRPSAPSVPSSSPPTPASGAGVPPASTQPTSSPSSPPPPTIPPPPSALPSTPAAPHSPSNAPPAKAISPQTHPSPDRLETEEGSSLVKRQAGRPPHEDG